jgi:hypothetical protein
MPLKPIGGYVTLKHLVDLLREYKGPIDTAGVLDALSRSAYKELPELLRPRTELAIPYTMQLVFVPTLPEGTTVAPDDVTQNAAGYSVLKYFSFENKEKVSTLKEHIIVGDPLTIDWGRTSDIKTPMKLFFHMLDRLGGVHFRCHAVASVAKALNSESKPYDRAKRRDGYHFIRTRGPKANNNNQFVEWTDDQIHDEASPIYGWHAGEVKESLSNYAKGKSGAKTIERWFLTLKDFEPEFLYKVVIPFLRTHHRHSIVWIGLTRIGKSSGSKTTCITVSAFQIDKHNRTDLIRSVVTGKKFKCQFADGSSRGVRCTGGTQVIDRFWQTLRKHLKSRTKVAGSLGLRTRIRSCQWVYWNQRCDLWLATGVMVSALT